MGRRHVESDRVDEGHHGLGAKDQPQCLCDSVDVLFGKLVIQGGNHDADLLVAPPLADRDGFAVARSSLTEPLIQSGLGRLPVRKLVVQHLKAWSPDDRFEECLRIVARCIDLLRGSASASWKAIAASDASHHRSSAEEK